MKDAFSVPTWRRAGAAVLIGGALAAHVLRLTDSGPVLLLAILAALLSAAALFGLPVGGLALGSLSGAYVAALLSSGEGLDTGAPFFGLGLFLLAELLYPERVPPAVTSPAARRERVWTTAAFAFAGLILAAVVLVLGSAVSLTGPLALGAAGVLAALLVGSVVFASGVSLAPDPSRRQDR